MKLFRVDVKFTGYVIAGSESDARWYARQLAGDLSLNDCASAVEVQHTDTIDLDWGSPDDEPYGGDDLTLAEAWPKPPPEPPTLFPELAVRPVEEE